MTAERFGTGSPVQLCQGRQAGACAGSVAPVSSTVARVDRVDPVASPCAASRSCSSALASRRTGSRPSVPPRPSSPRCRTESRAARRAAAGTLTELKGVGPKTAAVIVEALAGEVPGYLTKLEAETDGSPVATGGEAAARALRGDLHTHSDWSDGGSPIERDGVDRARPRPRVHRAHRPLAAADRGQRALGRAAAAAARRRRARSTRSWRRSGCSPASRSTSSRTAARPGGRAARPPRRRGRRVHSKLRDGQPTHDPADGHRDRRTRTPTCSATAPVAR